MKKSIKIFSLIGTSIISTVPIITLASCNKASMVDEIYNSSLNIYKEYCKHPHPSKSLDIARKFWYEEITKYGWEMNQDDYGNIWFDVPATKGYENYPKLILQGHMDMVVDGLDEKQAKIIPIEVMETKDKDGRPVLRSKGTVTGQGVATSIGADNGIGLSLIMSIVSSKNVSHGPIRCLFTADEEIGLEGAKHLDNKALQGFDNLISLDGEGSPEQEYQLADACDGLQVYSLKNKFNISTPTFSTHVSLSINGLYDQNKKPFHPFRSPNFKDDGNIYLSGNAETYLLDVLNTIINPINNKHIEISSFTFQQPSNVGERFREIPDNATVEFTTDASFDEVKTIADTIFNEWKNKYKNNNWTDTGVKHQVTDLGTTITKTISESDSGNLISRLYGMHGAPDEKKWWAGSSDVEKAKLNYPEWAANMFDLSLNSNTGDFVVSIASNETKIEYSKEARLTTRDAWKGWYGENNVETHHDFDCWDGTQNPNMANLFKKAFEHNKITYYVTRPPRGAYGECVMFITKNPKLNQVFIGPRLDDVHTKNETLYLDTFYNIVKVVLYAIDNIGKK